MPTDHPEFVHPSIPGGAEQLIGDALDAIRAADGRVTVGPWLGEVGFEVLYWIPFLHWLFERHEIPTAEVTVVSRGGAEPWYEGLCARYVDVFDAITPDDFRTATLELWAQTGGLQKQILVRSWDEEVLDRTLGSDWRDGALLHPQLLYRLFRNVWQAALPVRDFLDRAVHHEWRPPDHEVVASLPEEYTAVRFYFRDSFPDTPANRELVRSVVARLAARRPVVLLNTGLVVDEHRDAEPPAGERVLRPLAGIDPARNLAAQSAVIARASLFVGTYGGLAHLAPFYGVPTIGFAERLARDQPGAPDDRAPHGRRLRHAARCRRWRRLRAAGGSVSLRQHPRVRALARRHVGYLLRRARSWTNVDSSLRLLGEDRTTPVAFGRCDDPLLDALYWQPFIHWAREHFGLAKGAEGAATVPAEPVMALVEEYRTADAPPRPLLKRLRHQKAETPARRRSSPGRPTPCGTSSRARRQSRCCPRKCHRKPISTSRFALPRSSAGRSPSSRTNT